MCIFFKFSYIHLDLFLYFCIAGEDGQIKIWSKSGMLRSTLASQGKARDLDVSHNKLNVTNA